MQHSYTLVKKYLNEIRSADTWSIFHIISDFIKGFDRLSEIGSSVTISSSARFDENNPYYKSLKKLKKRIGHES